MLREIPQAAGITGALTAAGMPASTVHDWFHVARRELAGSTPAQVLLEQHGRYAGMRVLALAEADARELLAGLAPTHGGVEGTD